MKYWNNERLNDDKLRTEFEEVMEFVAEDKLSGRERIEQTVVPIKKRAAGIG